MIHYGRFQSNFGHTAYTWCGVNGQMLMIPTSSLWSYVMEKGMEQAMRQREGQEKARR